mmetsp:Transcript_38392/g.105749  ORF Transcript_38392/g.105749 Transcript_38392/m.105749 type:complete len:424 (-) Transcript_38392:75-1346(-)
MDIWSRSRSPRRLPSGAACTSKREPCWYHARGVCRRGADCTWLHDASDRALLPLEKDSAASNVTRKSAVCMRYTWARYCEDGDKCKYAHGPHELQGAGMQFDTECGTPAIPILEGATGSTLDIGAISVSLTPDDQATWVQKAARIFKDYRVVVLHDLVSRDVASTVLKSLRDLRTIWCAKYDPEGFGNRNWGRYELGDAYSSWHLTHLPGFLEALEEFSAQGGLELLERIGEFKFVGARGALVLAGTDTWQNLHSDFARPQHEELWPLWNAPAHIPFLELQFTVHPLTSTNGAMRIVPGRPSIHSTYWQKEVDPVPRLGLEPDLWKRSQLHPLPMGCGILRDVRVWHGGTPNLSDEDRYLPALRFYSTWALDLWAERLYEGKGVDVGDVLGKLSMKTQKVVSSHIVRSKEDEWPQLVDWTACW